MLLFKQGHYTEKKSNLAAFEPPMTGSELVLQHYLVENFNLHTSNQKVWHI